MDWIGLGPMTVIYKIMTAYVFQRNSDYPILSTVARRVFAISASSAQAERDFSSVGRTILNSLSIYSREH